MAVSASSPISAGALAAAGVEQDAVIGMCLGMSGVDREADASALKARLQGWLPQEARTLHAVDSAPLMCCVIHSSSESRIARTGCCNTDNW